MEEKKNSQKYLTILVIVLALALMVTGFFFYKQKKESDKVITQLNEYSTIVNEQKDSLENELKTIIVRYDSLKTNNDSINNQLEEQQDKIKRLLALRLSDAEKLRKYEQELGTIREVLRSYIVQIDSLNTRNQMLMAENVELRNKTVQVETINKQLSEEKEQLTEIKNEAETLLASNIAVVPLNKRSNERYNFKRVEKIRVDFILRKNLVTEPGMKEIFVRIIRPDQLILSSPVPGIIPNNEENLPYTASREVNYENDDIPVSIYWDNDGNLLPGNYLVELYAQGKKIGDTEFALQ